MNIMENPASEYLIRAILSLKTEEDCRSFLSDLMTVKEVLDMGQRLMVAKMLKEGTVYSKIAEVTGASTATISRVNRCLVYGASGYETILNRMNEQEKKD